MQAVELNMAIAESAPQADMWSVCVICMGHAI